MDLTAFFTMPSGLYVVSADDGEQKAGCIINTALQVTATPAQLSVAVNKQNVTAGVIERAGAFTVTVLDRTADMPYIGNFGFRTSDTYDKFSTYGCETSEVGSPYSPEHVCALFACKLVQTVDVGTHLMFIGEVVGAERLSDVESLTYGYYHAVLKGKTPPKASSYQG